MHKANVFVDTVKELSVNFLIIHKNGEKCICYFDHDVVGVPDSLV